MCPIPSAKLRLINRCIYCKCAALRRGLSRLLGLYSFNLEASFHRAAVDEARVVNRFAGVGLRDRERPRVALEQEFVAHASPFSGVRERILVCPCDGIADLEQRGRQSAYSFIRSRQPSFIHTTWCFLLERRGEQGSSVYHTLTPSSVFGVYFH